MERDYKPNSVYVANYLALMLPSRSLRSTRDNNVQAVLSLFDLAPGGV